MLKLHLIKQLSKNNIWSPNQWAFKSLADIRDAIADASIASAPKTKKCRAGCVIDSMHTTYHVFCLIKTEITKILDGMASEITFDANEKNGMILGFKTLDQ